MKMTHTSNYISNNINWSAREAVEHAKRLGRLQDKMKRLAERSQREGGHEEHIGFLAKRLGELLYLAEWQYDAVERHLAYIRKDVKKDVS